MQTSRPSSRSHLDGAASAESLYATAQESSQDEETLMAEHCAGDPQAFQRLYEKLAPSLHAYFTDAVKDPVIADDLLQVTLFKLHLARHRFRADRPLRPWILSIATRVKLDHFRKQAIGHAMVSEPVVVRHGGVVPGPDQREASGGLTAEQTDQIRAAIAALPQPQRQVIELHRYQELTFPEIAAIVGGTETAVRVRAFRGYERLRRRLGSMMKTFSQSRK
jgi:RNA polymerase sigma factor (sigma-70 family)